jgi:hypothetical protein
VDALSADRWRRIESLCHAALARPAGERAAFLAEACGGDAELRAEVESLVAPAESSPSFLETPAVGVAAAASLVGRQLGPFRIDAPLGAGGMGEVYRAKDTRSRDRFVAIRREQSQRPDPMLVYVPYWVDELKERPRQSR